MNWPSPLTGSNPLVSWLNRLLAAARSCELKPGVGYKLKKTPQGTVLDIEAKSGGGGFRWQSPNKELDPTLLVAKYTFVYITPGNDIVVTGLTDLVSNALTKACEGFWQANDDIPPKDGDGKYNVPVHPYPSATGTPTGSPGAVMGDLDAVGEDGKPAVKWIYWGQVACS